MSEGGHSRSAVFLDRDGVLNFPVVRNGKLYPPQAIEEFRLMPDVAEALHILKKLNFLLVVVTNQPDPLRGTQKKEIVEEMHCLLRAWLPVDDIFVAWDETSADYKPKIGLVEKAVKKHSIDLKKSFFVGDRWRDVECGKRAGCCTLLVDNGCGEPLVSPPDVVCTSLMEAAQIIACRTCK